MIKFFLLPTIFMASCASPAKSYMMPTPGINYTEVSETETHGITGKCALGLVKAVENNNLYYKNEGTEHSNDIIGENIQIRFSWCHKAKNNPDQFVVILVLGNKNDLKSEKTLMGPATYTYFDDDMNIVKWGF